MTISPKNKMDSITIEDIHNAVQTIKGSVSRTPCIKSHLSEYYGMNIYLKLEFMQSSGSFKERGARYTLEMLSYRQKQKGVITASCGNHALAVSYHGSMMNIEVTVVMPTVAPYIKINLCKKYGAKVIIWGESIEESMEYAMELVEKEGYTYINGYNDWNIIIGQSTLGVEIFEEVSDIDAILVPVGGAGLIAGLASSIKMFNPNVRIYGVESVQCPSFREALNQGKPVAVKSMSTLADGLAVPKVGANSFTIASKLVSKSLCVSEENISLAILKLLENEKFVVEGSGAVGLAALCEGLVPELKGKNVVIPITGGNIDPSVVGRCIDRGMAIDGRLAKFSLTVSDRVGGLVELCKFIARYGASIRDILHERAWIKDDIFRTRINCVVETLSRDHLEEFFEALEKTYPDVEHK